MDFHTEDRLRADVDAVLGAYADPGLPTALGALSPLSAGELVDHRRDGDVVHLEVRYAYEGDLPPGATHIVDPKLLTWVLATDLELTRRQASVILRADHYTDRLQARAVERFEARGSSGTTRITEGRLEVHVPLVGGSVERALIGGLQEWLANEADAIDAWITGRSTPAS